MGIMRGIFTREKDFEKWLPCSTPHNLPVDGCASTISQGMVSSSFHKRQVSLTHPLLPAEEERRTSPQKRQKTKKLPRETLLQNGAGTYIIATDVRSVWRTSSGKHFFKITIREKDSCGIRQNRTILGGNHR